jgi:hypothetical protein
MATGLVAALVYLRREFKAGPPLASVLRVLASFGAAMLFARFFPGQGKIVTLLVLALTAVIFLVVLIALREFGPQDRAKLAKILGRRAGG